MNRLLLAVLSMFAGSSYLFIKVLVGEFGPWSIAFLRSTIGVLILLLLFLWRKEPLNLRSIPFGKMVLVALCNTVIPWSLIAFSEITLTSSMASVLVTTTTLWTSIIGFGLFKNKVTRLQWGGLTVGLLGIVVLLDIGASDFLHADMLGMACALGGALSYAFGSQLSKRYLLQVSFYQNALVTLLIAQIFSGLVMITTESIHLSSFYLPQVLFSLLGLGVLCTGATFVLFYYLVQTAGPEFTSLSSYIAPGISILLGVLLLEELVTARFILGFILVVGGVLTVGLHGKWRRSQYVRYGRGT